MKNARVVSAHLVLFAALAAHRQESGRLSTDYLRRATPPLHWPQGLEPRNVDVFVHNEGWIDAPRGIVRANLIDATRRPGGHSNSPDAVAIKFRLEQPNAMYDGHGWWMSTLKARSERMTKRRFRDRGGSAVRGNMLLFDVTAVFMARNSRDYERAP